MILKESEARTPTKELVRWRGISANTSYSWRKEYGGLDVSDARRLKQLEDENRRLKKKIAEQTLDIAAMKDTCSRENREPREPQEGRPPSSGEEPDERAPGRECATNGVTRFWLAG